MEQPGGRKTERLRFKVTVDGFSNAVRSLVAKSGNRFAIKFEEQDLSGVRTANQFEKKIEELGWRDWKPPLNG